MADVVGKEVLGMKMLRREAAVGPPPDMATVLRGSAEQSLQEGRVKKALENLKAPGKMLDPIKIVDQYKNLTTGDEIDDPVRGTFKRSGEQGVRMQPGESAINVIGEYVSKKNYDSMDATQKHVCLDTLANYLINNPAFLAVKMMEDPTFDITSTAAPAAIRADAIAILRNPLLFSELQTVTADFLATAQVDYKVLHGLLKQKMGLSEEITALTAEIGVGGTSGSGLTHEVEDLEKDLKGYEVSIDPNDPTRMIKGQYVILGEDYRRQELSYVAEKRNYENVIAKATSLAEQVLLGASRPIFDPITGGLVNLDPTSFSMYMDQWKDKLLEINSSIEESKLKQRLLNEGKTKKQNELAEKKAEKMRKEAEKKTKQKALKDLKDGTLADEQKKVEGEERKISERAEGLLSEAVTNLWQDMSTEADKAREGKLKGLEGNCQKIALEALLKKINPKKQKYDVKTLKKFRNELVRDGVDKFGTARIDELITEYSLTTSTPEQKNFVPILIGIKNDPAKLTEFSTTLVKDMLGVVAYKKPKLLERLFTEDEQHMRGLMGDILPDLIMKAYEDPSARGKIDEMMGKNMIRKNKGEVREELEELKAQKGFWGMMVLALPLLASLGFKKIRGG